MVWLISTFLLLAMEQTYADNPALQAVLSQKGLQKGKTFHIVQKGTKRETGQKLTEHKGHLI